MGVEEEEEEGMGEEEADRTVVLFVGKRNSGIGEC